MIKPVLQDDAFVQDVDAARRRPGELHLWWLGQSGFLLQWAGRHLLFDPYLSDSLTRKYAGTDKPHDRMAERVVAPERLALVDVVTSSHNHTDHLDADTLRPLTAANPALRLVCARANLALARERSGLEAARLIGLDPETAPGDAEVAGFRFSAVPAAHEAFDTDGAGLFPYVGFVVRAGPWTVYHSGDTVLFPGMAERLAAARIDVALLPINGRAPERRVAGNLWGREAARLAHAAGVRVVVPCHFDMFRFNTATTEEFVAECERLGQACQVMGQGERFSLNSGFSRGVP